MTRAPPAQGARNQLDLTSPQDETHNMAKNSVDAYGAAGKTNLLLFDPATLTIVTDPAHPLYDSRVQLEPSEAMARNVMLRRAGGADLAGVMASENALRKDESPISRAEKMRTLINLGRSEEQVGIIFGVEAATVRRSLALLDCTQAVRDAVAGGNLTVARALKLGKLSPDQQRAKVAELASVACGVVGHAKARAQRAVVGDRSSRLRSEREIRRRLKAASGDYARALRWVLGDDAAPLAPDAQA